MEKPERPRLVSLFALVLAGIAVLSLLRLRAGILAFEYFETAGISISPWYFIISGCIGAAVFTYSAFTTFRGHPLSKWIAGASSAGLILLIWFERLLLNVNSLNSTNRAFWGLACLGLVLFEVYLFFGSKARLYFATASSEGEEHEQQPA